MVSIRSFEVTKWLDFWCDWERVVPSRGAVWQEGSLPPVDADGTGSSEHKAAGRAGGARRGVGGREVGASGQRVGRGAASHVVRVTPQVAARHSAS